MGQEELIEELRRIGKESAEAVRRETAAEIEQLRSETSARLDALRGVSAERRDAACAEETRALLAGAVSQARLIRVAAENTLAERLYEEARRSLHCLREKGYDSLFTNLAAELPLCRWERIRVNPADRERARKRFPDVEIAADDAVSGGLEATADGGRIRVDNTLEKRLERGWPELLPTLVRRLEEA
jgi:V/A-type H+/Na+-transporting ATPase subunit E